MNEETTLRRCAPSVAFFPADFYRSLGLIYPREYFSGKAAIKAEYLR
jgi:hypothetical protein